MMRKRNKVEDYEEDDAVGLVPATPVKESESI